PHCLVEADRRREVLEITRRLSDAEDALERAARDADLAPGLGTDASDRLEPGRVRREGGDQHPSLRLRNLREKSGVDALLRSRRLVLEHVRGVAHEGEHAAIADLSGDV